jgi:DNA-binding NtrC family response regulator
MIDPREVQTKPASERLDDELHLVVFGDRRFESFRLPLHGTVVIGRSSTADVQVDAAEVSRRHAVLQLGDEIRITDLGSVNGTSLRGRRLAADVAVPLRVGEIFEIGALSFALRRSGARAQPVAPSELSAALGGLFVVPGGAIEQLMPLVQRVAASALSVVIAGETGAGKEGIAHALHALSPRARGPFLAINCAAFADALLESELFGHERGAFTGAVADKQGLLASASGGTVFLDEIGEMSAATQAKLLRVVEHGECTPVGGLRPVKLDVRFIAATHRPLDALIANGQFRADLYFRLSGMTITVPPLRDRANEIVPLARHFAGPSVTLSPGAEEALRTHRWPGNVRELKQVIERARVVAGGPRIDAEHVDLGAGAPPRASLDGDLRSTLDDHDRKLVVDALARANGNQTKAAELLGISRRALIARLDKYGLPRPRKG